MCSVKPGEILAFFVIQVYSRLPVAYAGELPHAFFCAYVDKLHTLKFRHFRNSVEKSTENIFFWGHYILLLYCKPIKEINVQETKNTNRNGSHRMAGINW